MQQTAHLYNNQANDQKPVSPRRMGLNTGVPGRRQWPDEVRARIVMESLVPGAIVTQVAQRNGCRPKQIHDWRRLVRSGRLALPAPLNASEVPAFVPLLSDPAQAPASMFSQEYRLEIEIAGATVRVCGRPSAETLAEVFSALRRTV